ncbi:MAG: hypothetical protein HDT21_07765 [Ruminococcus sp.]|nr:hypothetical protein [Ruminococcus sp.]
MKETVYKFFTAVLTVLIFFGMLHAMSILSDLNDYNYIKRAAEKNSGLAADGPDIPAVSAKAPAEAMRTEPAPITAEDLSYIYIDGIKFDFPCTLADIQKHFETRKYTGYYDEKNSEYKGTEILIKNGVGSYRIGYTSDSIKPLPEECIVTSIGISSYSEKYSPRLTVAGMDIYNISDKEILRLTALDGNEYLKNNLITYPHGNDGYISLNYIYKTVAYYKKDNPEDMKTIEKINPILIKTELRLPDGYDIETVSENKEELREFALEYYAYDENDTSLFSNNEYCKEVEVMVNDIYLTAYEFLATVPDGYNALYYELTEIESLKKYDDNWYGYDTGYLKVTANCYIEGYDDPAKMDMILKAGDRLGDALLIQIDL